MVEHLICVVLTEAEVRHQEIVEPFVIFQDRRQWEICEGEIQFTSLNSYRLSLSDSWHYVDKKLLRFLSLITQEYRMQKFGRYYVTVAHCSRFSSPAESNSDI